MLRGPHYLIFLERKRLDRPVKERLIGFSFGVSDSVIFSGLKISFQYLKCGRIAQLGEHLPYKQRVIGSSPIVPTKKEQAKLALFFIQIKNYLLKF